MKAFKFTLQSVRTVRQEAEQAATNDYVQALLSRTRALERLGGAEANLRAAEAEWQRRKQEGCTALDMVRYSEHCQALQQQRDQAAAWLRQARQMADSCLEKMLVARREREALDKLMAQQKAAYDLALARDQQKQIDEMGGHAAENSALSPHKESTAL